MCIKRYAKFSFFGFFNSACLFENYSAYRTCNAHFRSIEIYKLSLTVKEIGMKAFSFFNSA